jgi:hypothetical protein
MNNLPYRKNGSFGINLMDIEIPSNQAVGDRYRPIRHVWVNNPQSGDALAADVALWLQGRTILA